MRAPCRLDLQEKASDRSDILLRDEFEIKTEKETVLPISVLPYIFTMCKKYIQNLVYYS